MINSQPHTLRVRVIKRQEHGISFNAFVTTKTPLSVTCATEFFTIRLLHQRSKTTQHALNAYCPRVVTSLHERSEVCPR